MDKTSMINNPNGAEERPRRRRKIKKKKRSKSKIKNRILKSWITKTVFLIILTGVILFTLIGVYQGWQESVQENNYEILERP